MTNNFPLDKIGHFKSARLASYLSDAPYPGKKLAAVIHKGKQVLALGINSFEKTHTLQGEGVRQYLHAEVAALLKRRHYDDLSFCSITVYRESHGLPALAKPCSQCQRIMKDMGIKKVYFSIPDEPFFDVMKL